MASFRNIEDNGVVRWKKRDLTPHRQNGAAVIFPDGAEFWYLDGVPYRNDGPYCYGPNVKTKWCLGGDMLTFEEWCKQTYKTPEEIIYLKLKYT